MSNFEETETMRVLNTLFPGKENIIIDVLGSDPIHMVSHLRFQTDQEFIDEFYNTLSNSEDEYAQKIFTKIKTDIDTVIYKYLKNNAYDTSIPNELKIELDGKKFLFAFLDGAIYTVDKRFRTVYGSKFTYLPYLFYYDIKVVVEESDDCVDIEIYHRDNLVETHTLKPVLVIDDVKPLETCPPEVDILNRVFKDTNFHRSFMEWVYKDQVLTPYDVKFLVVTFLFTYSNQEMVDDYYNTFSKISWCDIDEDDVEFVCSINREIGKTLYRKLEPYAYERNREKYELKIELDGFKFLFTFSDFSICTLNKKYHVDYFPRFKGIQHMFVKDTRASIQNLKLTADLIILNIYYGESSKDMYTLGYNEFDDTPVEHTPPLGSHMDRFILNYDENQSVLKFFVNYKLTEEEIENGKIQVLDDLVYPNIEFLTDLEEFTGIGDGDILRGVIYKIICRFQDKNYKINGKLIGEYLKESEVETTELERAKLVEVIFEERKAAQERIRTLISEVSSNNDCGESEDSDVDSVKEYREATELHTKIISDFYVRKRIFRHEFNSDAIITQLNLSEDVKERIFKEFDEFSDRFSAVYKGTKSFLPYRYLFFKLLRNAGFPYTYECTFQKMKAMEKIYWSLKDAKDYEEFIRFLNHGANIVCEKEYKVFDSPKKIVISEFKHSIKEAYYLLTVKHELDLVIQYFTKFLPKINKRPEYQYNLIIMEMEEEKMEITFESIFLDIVDALNERMNLNVMFMIKEEIN